MKMRLNADSVNYITYNRLRKETGSYDQINLNCRTLMFILLVLVCSTKAEDEHLPSILDVKALSDKLLQNYSKYILPSSKDGPFNVSIHVDLRAVGEIDEIEEKLSTVFWFYYNWIDESINWKENETHIHYISLGWDTVWTPILRVYNPHADVSKSQNTDRSYDTVIYDSNGTAFFDEMMTTHTTCDLDMTYYPFDIQSCDINMRILGDTKFMFNVSVVVHKTFSIEDANHGSWTLLNKSVSAHFGSFKINLKFKRRPLFLLIHVLFPIIVLALLTPIVFILPKKSGERVGYSITMLLAISVYMTIVSDNLPQNSQPMPLISIMVFIWYVLDALIVFVVIINTKINSRRDTDPLSHILRKFVLLTRKLIFISTCKQCGRSKIETDEGPSEETEKCIDMETVNNGNDHCEDQSLDETDQADPDKITWQDLSTAIDKWCFVISYLFKVTLPVVFLSVTKAHSHMEST